jgi:hypothetical protein
MVHAPYLYYLYFIFVNWGSASSNSPIPKHTTDGKGHFHQSLRFRTLAIESLAWIYKMFYPEGKKIVPSNINEYLNPRVLAYWIMDDGSWAGSGILIHCNSFNLSDVKHLSLLLQKTFNLRITIRKKGNNHILYIHAESISTLKKLIKPYMHTTFYYKLGIKKKLI